MTINKIEYKIIVEIIAIAVKGKIIPEFNHLINLSFLLITLTITSDFLNISFLKLVCLLKKTIII